MEGDVGDTEDIRAASTVGRTAARRIVLLIEVAAIGGDLAAVSRSQILAVPSRDAEASRIPSGL